MQNKLIKYMDCIKGMRDHVKDQSIHFAICDPPYKIGFDSVSSQYNRDKNNVIPGYQEVKEDYYIFSKKYLTEIYRILKPTGQAYVFSGWNYLKDVLNALDEIGFITINHLIWKYQFGVYTKIRWVSSHYHCLFVVKNAKKYTFNKQIHYAEDVLLQYKRPYRRGKKKNKTKLPNDLVEMLILNGSNEGELVIDPFLGNGTTAAMALKNNRGIIGFEINKECREIINNEIKIALENGEINKNEKKRNERKKKNITHFI